MALSIGIFALMAVLTFAPATMPDSDPATTEPQPDAGEVPAPEDGTPIASTVPVSDGLGMALRVNERRCCIDDVGLCRTASPPVVMAMAVTWHPAPGT